MVHSGARELGHRSVRVSASGSGKPHRLHSVQRGAVKITQEVITLSVFAPFAMLYLREPMKLDYLWAGLCLLGAVYFMFRS
jgi:uncharacterized protein (DUF486 family)